MINHSISVKELNLYLNKLKTLHSAFDYIKISLASPLKIKSWAERVLPNGIVLGEVCLPEIIIKNNIQSENGGLFCEKIFGPLTSWKCKCGKYLGYLLDKICEECFVEVTDTRVRRYRMGYIDLMHPVVHIWYLYGQPHYLCILLNAFYPTLTVLDIENIIYGVKEDRNKNFLELVMNIFTSEIYSEVNELNIIDNIFNKQEQLSNVQLSGVEILHKVLLNLNLNHEIKRLRTFLTILSQNHFNASSFSNLKKIRIFESFLSTRTNPSWMILTTLPVLPPHLRPLYELENGKLITTGLNELYLMVLNRNQQLFNVLEKKAVNNLYNFLENHQQKVLQESVDCLIDNARTIMYKNAPLHDTNIKSLSDILLGKDGRFRQTLLGKRVDYSGRSIIIVGPTLRLNQCGLPYIVLKELFYPFLVSKINTIQLLKNIPLYSTLLLNYIIDKNKPLIWLLLNKISQEHCILLNRAPTLHRFGIQAFDPLLILGQAISLHPLVCTGFNADFDGDQMAIHLPLYNTSQLELRTMMRSSFNILSTADGTLLLKLSQDIIIGCYYLTVMITQQKFKYQKWFTNENEALTAFYQKKITLHTPILVRYCLKRCQLYVTKKSLFQTKICINLGLNINELLIYKMITLTTKPLKIYLITNLGILVLIKSSKTTYLLQELFLETTPGRLIFSLTLKNIINN
jgi:DNA-directed RNA polymerase subunit beta'